MTVIYEVNLNVDRSVEADFGRWLSSHVEDMLALPGFVAAELASKERDPDQTANWSVRYRLVSRQAWTATLKPTPSTCAPTASTALASGSAPAAASCCQRLTTEQPHQA